MTGETVGAGFAESLREKLRAEGRPWGDDEPGRAFAEDYVPAADAISEAAADAAAALTRLAAELRTRDM